MQMWVLKPASHLLFLSQTPTPKNLCTSPLLLFPSPVLISPLCLFPSFKYSSLCCFSFNILSSLFEFFLYFFLKLHSKSCRKILMASCSLLMLVAFMFLLFSTNSKGVFSYGEKELLSLKKFQRSEGNSKRSFLSQKSRTENGATILEMRHTDYFSGIISDWNQRLQKWLQADRIRVNSIQARIRHLISGKTEAHSQTQVPITSGVNLHTLNYIVPVTLGGRNMTVIVDTGSDLTWVQCQPCKLCYNQPEPLFDPSMSSSYHSISCMSSACQSLQFATGNVGLCGGAARICNYEVSYGDGSYTRGELGSERLILGTIPIEKFVFGCGRNNKGLFGAASGLMGLGRSDLSLISQSTDVFGGVFSYCLPTTDVGSSGSLILGGDSSVYKNSTPFTYTRIVPNPQLVTFYFLNLTGINIGGVNTESSSFGKAGILIDSGTVITRLPPSIYKAVKTEFLKQFSGYPSAPSFSILDTCFNLSSYDEVDIPTVKMQFEGDAELTVDVSGIVYFAKSDASQVCLALASLTFEDEIGIIGNYQQRNTRIIYDTKSSRLGFAKETCSFY